MLWNSLSPSRRFTYAMFIVSPQANKGMKVYEGRKTSATLFIIIPERNSRPGIGLHSCRFMSQKAKRTRHFARISLA